MKWMECVPNFSEGRNPYIIKSIGDTIRGVKSVVLLHVDPGWDANRTVYTFAGEPEAVCEAAFLAIMKAAELIDMRQHKGEHPRMGACDVCPLIPLGEMNMEATVTLSHQLGERLGAAGIPVFMYERSATRPERSNLAHLRKGEYEHLPIKLRQPDWQPDYGPAGFQERFGAMVLGARQFLIAYNINLNTDDVGLAKLIASRIRESGYRDANGLHHAGLLKGVKAIGWYMEKYGCAQVSTNIVDFETTGIRKVFDAVRNVAESLGAGVNGSELIGMIPEKALLEAGRSLQPEETSIERLVFTALDYLGLDIVPNERILEWAIREKTG